MIKKYSSCWEKEHGMKKTILTYIEEHYPSSAWTNAYKDWSTTSSTENRGWGILLNITNRQRK